MTDRQIAAAYRTGATTRAIAARFGVDEKTVRRRLAALRVPRRRSGPPLKPASTAEIIEMVAAGYTYKQIAEHVGMSPSGVQVRWRKAMGLPRWGNR